MVLWFYWLYWNLNHRMPSCRKYYPENFNFIFHMVQKLLLLDKKARISQLWTPMKKVIRLQFGPLVVRYFHYQPSLKMLSFGVLTFVKNAQKPIFRGSGWLLGKPWNTYKWINLQNSFWFCLPHMLAYSKHW